MVLAISVYFNFYIHDEKTRMDKIKKKYQEIEELQKKIEEAENASTDTSNLDAKKLYLVSKKNLFEASNFLVKDMVILYLKMINIEEDKRPGVKKVASTVQKIKSEFDDLVNESKKIIYQYENKAKSVEPDLSTRMSTLASNIPKHPLLPRELKKAAQVADLPANNSKDLTNQKINRHLILL